MYFYFSRIYLFINYIFKDKNDYLSEKKICVSNYKETDVELDRGSWTLQCGAGEKPNPKGTCTYLTSILIYIWCDNGTTDKTVPGTILYNSNQGDFMRRPYRNLLGYICAYNHRNSCHCLHIYYLNAYRATTKKI